jgi:hypothetical protein
MANLNLPSLRNTNITSNGTITVPAGETWVVKTANIYVDFINGAGTRSASVTATINGNSNIIWRSTLYNGATAGITNWSYGMEQGGPLFSSSVVMEAGDTLSLTISGTTNSQTLSIYYYILEEDF